MAAQRSSMMVARGARIEARLREAASRRQSHLELIRDRCTLGAGGSTSSSRPPTSGVAGGGDDGAGSPGGAAGS
eukprot:294598-Chlamydomonas_euryale.AAC.2